MKSTFIFPPYFASAAVGSVVGSAVASVFAASAVGSAAVLLLVPRL
jgi:hypothetical protein